MKPSREQQQQQHSDHLTELRGTDKVEFRVKSAKQTVIIYDAKDAFDACVKAVKTGEFDGLGWIMQVEQEGQDDMYCSSERVCKAAGMWGEK